MLFLFLPALEHVLSFIQNAFKSHVCSSSAALSIFHPLRSHLELVAAIMNRVDTEYLFYHSISQHWNNLDLSPPPISHSTYSSCHYPPQSAIKPLHPQQLSSPCKSSISLSLGAFHAPSHNQPSSWHLKVPSLRQRGRGGGESGAEGPFPWLCKALQPSFLNTLKHLLPIPSPVALLPWNPLKQWGTHWGHQSFHDNFSCLIYQENQPLLRLLWRSLPPPYILLPVYLQADAPKAFF